MIKDETYYHSEEFVKDVIRFTLDNSELVNKGIYTKEYPDGVPLSVD